ncbi:MAG: insulinase family protein [Leptospiraceae bacterium]|nr:insulinase family protein [Leptospiraceae bacterium]MBP9162587.1 insulinase family protein [Leptospiraceae bacterium]
MIKKKILSSVSFLVLIAFTQIDSVESKKIKFVRYKLENGLTILLHKDNTSPIVSLGVMYHVGSKNEAPNRTGFAHFFEHLMFEGTKNIKRGEFDKLILNAGGESNAHTTFDYTYYNASLPANELPLILWMESERLLQLEIDTSGLETQRKVVKEERRERLDNQPYGNLTEILHEMSYKKHPYRWLPIGSTQYIDKATLQEFVDFHQKFYVPENAVLVIAGDIKIKDTKKLIKKYFERIPKSGKNIQREKIFENPFAKEISKTVYYNVEFPALSYSFHAPALGTDDYYPFIFIDLILSNGESSRLNQNLKNKNDLVVNLETYYNAMEDNGLYSITCYAKNDDAYKKVPRNLNDELLRLQTEFVTERELEKVKNRVQRIIFDSNANLAGIAQNLAEYETFYGNAGVINTEYEKILVITKEDIQRVAKKYFTLDKKVILNYLPPKKK